MRGNEAKWDALLVEGVEEVVSQSVRRVAGDYDFIEQDDWEQEARVLVATSPDLYSCVLGDDVELGLLQYRLVRDLINKANVERSQRKRNISYDERYAETSGDEYAPRPVSTIIRRDTIAYDRELVEALMPAVWDESYCYGMRMENAPDADMPRGSINKATGNTLAAHIADIKTGWEKAPLTDRERRALLLGYGFDWQVTEIAFNQGVTKQTISERLASGVGKIVATLNGQEPHEWFTEAAA